MHPALNATLFKGVGVSLIPFMAAQTDGLWFDTAKTDRMFQESSGPTPADDPNEVIGLAMDQRLWSGATLAQVLAGQSPVVPNGDFAGGATGWNLAANWSIGSGLATAALGVVGFLSSQTPVAVGKLYRVEYDYSYASGGGIQAGCGDVTDAAISSTGSGTRTFFPLAIGTYQFQVFANNAAATIDNVSVLEIPGSAATQATAGFKPKYQTAGATFDANDDSLLTGYLAQNGANFIVAYVDVPASIPATQVVAGASGAAANRCFLAFNTSGQLCGGVGSNSTSTILGTTDWRGQTVVVGLSFDGSTVKLFAGTAEEYSGAQASTPTTAIPFRIGALNNNGTAGSFSGVALKDLLVGRQALTLGQFRSIRTQLIAGA